MAAWRPMVADTLTPEERSLRMALVKSKDSRPEMRVRRLVHGLGYRYRLHRRDLPGTPDLVFKTRKKVVWVHGCFWHRHSDPMCKLARLPKSKTEFWAAKLTRNRQRDLQAQEQLRALGWDFLVIWECELSNLEAVALRLENFLGREQDGVA